MQRKIEIVAKDEKEAMDLAVSKLHIAADKIYISVLGELPEGLNCEALVDVNLPIEGRRYLEGILAAMGIGYKIEVRSINDESEIHYIIETSENSLLIGANGKTLDALQTLVRNLISNYTKDRIVTTLDIGSYRRNRDRRIEIIATKTAKTVAKTKIAAKLEPMNAYDRHVVHEALADWRDVYTESEGEGSNRAVVIKPKQK